MNLCVQCSHFLLFQALLFSVDVISTEMLIPRKVRVSEDDVDFIKVVKIEKDPGESLVATVLIYD